MPITKIQNKMIRQGLKTARIIKNSNKSRSISRLSKDSIVQYPVIISNSIDNAHKLEIIRGLERQVASMLLIYLSTNNIIDMNKYKNVSNFIKSFHDNSAIPYDLDYANDLIKTATLGGSSPFSVESYADGNKPGEFALEFSKAILYSADFDVPLEKNAVLECWQSVHNEINTNKLNDVYKPFVKTKRAIENAIGAMEANKHDNEIGNISNALQDSSKLYEKNHGSDFDSPNGNVGINNKGISNSKINNNKGTANPKLIEDKNNLLLSSPTMVECELILNGNGNLTSYKFIFGVKAMPRLISSDILVSNIVAGLSNSGIFKFIKWTKGELKFVKDILFGISDAKDDARISKTASKVFSNLRSLKRRNTIGKITGRNVPATTIIVMTDYDAERIKEISNIDLRDPFEAIKYMKKQFLLGLAIYNTETEIFSYIMDNDEDYQDVSISSLKNLNNKNTTINDITDALKTIAKI